MRLKIKVVMGIFALIMPQVALGRTPDLEPNQIRITGTVPEARVIVVDAKGEIQQIFSNTNKSVTPKVAAGTYGGAAVPYTPRLRAQYDELMGGLRTNRVVSVQRQDNEFELDYPNFARSGDQASFTVTPTRMRGDDVAEAYEISL